MNARKDIMEKFKATQGDITAELSNNTIFIEGSYIFDGNIHDFRVWLDRLDDLLNSKVSGDNWLPEDIYGHNVDRD